MSAARAPFFHLPIAGQRMTAEYKVHGDIAVISLNNPPVNGLGYETRIGITSAGPGLADAAVKAIVITGAGKAFSGGADIREFGSPKAMQEPTCCR
jgi:3-hydroxyacyl-CoA dehydrogenase